MILVSQSWEQYSPHRSTQSVSLSNCKAKTYLPLHLKRQNLSHNTLFCQIPMVSSLLRGTITHNTLFCQIPMVSSLLRGTGPFLPSLLLTVLTLLPQSQPSFVLLSIQDKNERRIILVVPEVITCSIQLTSFWIVLHLNLSGGTIFGTTSSIFNFWSRPGAWPDCWVSMEFLPTPSLRRCRVAPPPITAHL